MIDICDREVTPGEQLALRYLKELRCLTPNNEIFILDRKGRSNIVVTALSSELDFQTCWILVDGFVLSVGTYHLFRMIESTNSFWTNGIDYVPVRPKLLKFHKDRK